LPGAFALGSQALALGAALLHSAAALAGVNGWSASGPPDRVVHAVATDPSNPLTVCAGTEEGGVYRTLDGGKNWRHANLSGRVVGVLAVSPAPASVVYAGLDADGVFRSTDGGTTWSRSSADQGRDHRRLRRRELPSVRAAHPRRGGGLSRPGLLTPLRSAPGREASARPIARKSRPNQVLPGRNPFGRAILFASANLRNWRALVHFR